MSRDKLRLDTESDNKNPLEFNKENVCSADLKTSAQASREPTLNTISMSQVQKANGFADVHSSMRNIEAESMF